MPLPTPAAAEKWDQSLPLMLCFAPLVLCTFQYLGLELRHWWVARDHAAQLSPDTDRLSDAASSAIQSYQLLCREAELKARKQAGEKLAAQVPDSAMVEAFKRQIAEAEANMTDFVKGYNRSLRTLAQANDARLASALDQVGTEPARAALVPTVLSDVQRVRRTPAAISVENMAQSCR